MSFEWNDQYKINEYVAQQLGWICFEGDYYDPKVPGEPWLFKVNVHKWVEAVKQGYREYYKSELKPIRKQWEK